MAVKNFEDLNVWKQSPATHSRSLSFNESSRNLSRTSACGIKSDGQRSRLCQTSRKDFERGGNQEFVQFLYVSKASCGESTIAALCRT